MGEGGFFTEFCLIGLNEWSIIFEECGLSDEVNWKPNFDSLIA